MKYFNLLKRNLKYNNENTANKSKKRERKKVANSEKVVRKQYQNQFKLLIEY